MDENQDQFTPKKIPDGQPGAEVNPNPARIPEGPNPNIQHAPSDEKITVKKDVLDKILEDNKIKDQQLKDLQETVGILMQTADKGRLAHIQALNGKPIVHQYRLRTFKDVVIIKWKLKEDIMEKGTNGLWRESQIVQIWTEDGKEYDMPLAQFERVPKIPVKEVSKEQVDVLGTVKVYYKVQTEAGKEYKVEAPFIN